MTTEEQQSEPQPDGQYSVLEKMTEEQFLAVGEAATKLVESDQNLRRIAITMLTAKRLYTIARVALTRELESEGYTWADGIEEFLIQAAYAEATKPFNRGDVVIAVRDIVAQLLLDEVDAEAEQVRTDALRLAQLKETARLASSPAVGPAAEDIVERGSTLILTGPSERVAEALKSRLEYIQGRGWRAPAAGDDANWDQPFRIVHLSLRASDQEADDLHCVCVPLRRWGGLLANLSRAGKILDEMYASPEGGHTDVLIIDSLLLTNSAESVPHTSAEAMSIVAGAHKFISRWCKRSKVALVAAVPIPVSKWPLEIAISELRDRLGEHAKIVVLDEPEAV